MSPNMSPSTAGRPTSSGDRPAMPDRRSPAPRAPFWLTDQRLSVQDRNAALARYSRSRQSLMG